MDLSVQVNQHAAPASLPVEIVERKGRGHPDTIGDALAEEISVLLCRHYRERFGALLAQTVRLH